MRSSWEQQKYLLISVIESQWQTARAQKRLRMETFEFTSEKLMKTWRISMHSFCLHLCKEITEEFHKNYLKNLSGNMDKERVTLKQGLNKKQQWQLHMGISSEKLRTWYMIALFFLNWWINWNMWFFVSLNGPLIMVAHWWEEDCKWKNMHHTVSGALLEFSPQVSDIMTLLQQVVHHSVPKFHCFKGFLIVNTCKNSFWRFKKDAIMCILKLLKE